MPDPENETPDFDELQLPGDDLTAAEPSEASASADKEVAPSSDQETKPELEKAEAEDQSEEKKGRKKKEKKTRKKKQRLPKEEKEEEKSGGLLQAVSRASPYTVMLGLALLAIMIAIFCVFKELGRYDYDIKADKAKGPVVTVPAVQFGPASTIEAA